MFLFLFVLGCRLLNLHHVDVTNEGADLDNVQVYIFC